MDLLYTNLTSVGETDCMRWVPNSIGKFTAHSYYECLRGATRKHFQWKSIWGSKVPKKVAFF